MAGFKANASGIEQAEKAMSKNSVLKEEVIQEINSKWQEETTKLHKREGPRH